MSDEHRGDLVAGCLAVVFGISVLLYVRGFPSLPGGLPGPALFPGIIAGLFVVFGSTLVVRWARRRRTGVPTEVEQDACEQAPPPPTRRTSLNAAAVLASVVFYLAVVEVLGFTVTMTVLLLALMLLLGVRALVAVPAAVVTTLLMVLLFQYMLLVPLPTGFLG